ncbi:P-loop containing nucleoside triphosphate hydrolase protein, partial [Choanephora cucurbitarum]
MKDTQGQVAAVQVAIRVRPLTERDRSQRFSSEVLRAQERHIQVIPQNKYFHYDHVFGPETHQSDIFASLGEKPVQKFVEGYNVTMLAYGQTSSGKTYTMGTAQHTDATDPEQDGIVPRAMALLFSLLQQQQQSELPTPTSPRSGLRPVSQIGNSNASQKYRYSVKVSFVEIYNEDLIDLLNPALPSEKPPVTIREDTKGHIYWTGVKEVTVHNTDDVLYFLQQGTENRATGFTDMNAKSSRSHAIFSVTLKQERFVSSATPQSSRAASPTASKLQQKRLSPARPPTNEDGDWVITSSKFHFVDLAGSERLKRTAAEGDRRKEGININAGLLALGNVISALGDPSKKSTHVPYRDSKLTRLLQDSLGGSAMTLMIACVSPAESNLSETLNTLQYANRARNIKNKMEKNEMEEWMTTDNLDFLRTTISKLKNELRTNKAASPSKSGLQLEGATSPEFDEEVYHQQHAIIADLQQQVEELQGAAEFIRGRNVVVENELVRLRQERTTAASDFDFQHLVEPVIEEYEKSISGLESQLAMIRAALSHSDQGFEEQQAKIEQLEIVIESQEKTIGELRRRVSKLLERRLKDETYIAELEKKLMTAVEETVRDREMLSELRGKILKLKEVDENTEEYIHDLEGRLTASEAERLTLKEKLNDMMNSAKVELQGSNEEKRMVNQEHEKQLQELTEKHDVAEKERHRLQAQVDQLLSQSTLQGQNENLENAVKTQNEMKAKDYRIKDLESDLANLQHEHQETLKELDEVLLRYQEALEHAEHPPILPVSDIKPNTPNSDEEVQLLRQSIQHLEQELDMASRRESILRQLSEDHHESVQVEKTLQKLEIQDTSRHASDLDHSEFILQSIDTLQKKYEHLRTKMQIQSIHIETDNEDDLQELHSMADFRASYESQILAYKREIKNLTRVMKDIKRIRSNETKTAITTHPEHRILMKSIVGLDKQLTEQYEKMKLEAKRFASDISEMISFNSGLENELAIMNPTASEGTQSGSSSVPSSPRVRNSMIR